MDSSWTLTAIVNLVTAFGTIVAAAAAAYAAIQSRRAVDTALSSAREVTASNTVKKYIEMALSNPDVANLKKKSLIEKENWFVTFLLLMTKDVLAVHRDDRDWIEWLRLQLGLFSDSLKEWLEEDKKNQTRYLASYGDDVVELVKDVVEARKQVVAGKAS